jgi:hypothetical protein
LLATASSHAKDIDMPSPLIAARSAAAIVAVAIAVGTLAPVAAFAQPMPPQAEGPGMRSHENGGMPWQRHMRVERPGADSHANRRGIGLERLLDFGRSAEALEIAFVRLAYAIDMTPEQQALFEALRDDALAAQETFAATALDLRPDTSGEPADLSELFDNRIALGTARIEAMTAVQPAFEAFFDTLTDEQKADLMPRRAVRAPAPGDAPMEPPAETPAEG